MMMTISHDHPIPLKSCQGVFTARTAGKFASCFQMGQSVTDNALVLLSLRHSYVIGYKNLDVLDFIYLFENVLLSSANFRMQRNSQLANVSTAFWRSSWSASTDKN